MKENNRTARLLVALFAAAGVFLLGGFAAYGYVRISALSEGMEALEAELALTRALVAEGVSKLERKTVELSDALYSAEQAVGAIQGRLGGFEQTVGQISGSVTVLEKLSRTDPELLQKYSKVYFLNEHYAPERLAEVNKEYLYSEGSPELIHAEVWPRLAALLNEARAEGATLYVKSAYRSFTEQKATKSAYTVTYGAGTANQFSADQGYSEHQLGTAVDFITTGLGGQLAGFETTQAYQWLRTNAHKYGFVLSYPPGNAYYVFEPWHWRYAGVELATVLHERNEYFYDLEQREIDEYLVKIFD